MTSLDEIINDSRDAREVKRDAVRVAPQVREHLSRPAKRWLRIDHPLCAAHTGDQVGKGTLICEVREAGMKAERTPRERFLQAVEKQPPEQP